MPSSSPVIISATEPRAGLPAAQPAAAAAKAATPDFMSTAPRPQSSPPSITAENGGCVHAAASPTGTTSVWPLNPSTGPVSPQRA